MAGITSKAGRHSLEAGMRELARHRPDRALRLLREAVESCPAGETGELERRLYWLSVALLRLDQPEVALRNLASARKLRPRGHASSAFAFRANEYGMPRRSSSDLDDFYAFFSVQTCLFLSKRPGRRFVSEAEKDNVTRLVAFAWQEVKRSGRLARLSTEAKLELFRQWPRVFPDFVPPSLSRVKAAEEGTKASEDACPCQILHVDFASRKKL